MSFSNPPSPEIRKVPPAGLTRIFYACYNATRISNEGKSTLVGALSEPGLVQAGGWRPAEDRPGAAEPTEPLGPTWQIPPVPRSEAL